MTLNAIIDDIDINPKINIQKPREILQYKKTDMTKFKNSMKTFSDKIIRDNNKGVNEIWIDFKTKISNGIDECTPSKMAKTVNKFTWINSTIKKLIRKRDKAY